MRGDTDGGGRDRDRDRRRQIKGAEEGCLGDKSHECTGERVQVMFESWKMGDL